ncbi:MAG TPA: MATE family efflux transporter [Methanomicrobia archaeon]|nr:MATE family efflux transporter [Methanomicrobia archaeon]
MRSVSKDQILHGPIVKVLFLLGWPIMISSLLGTAYTLADTFWLGRLDDARNAVAALQISWPIIFFLISFAFGFGSAGIALVSQYTGADNIEEAEKSAGQVISISMLIGTAIALIGFMISPFIVGSLGLEPDVSLLSTEYMRLIFLGLPFMFGSFTFGFIMRAYGDTITPMLVDGFAVTLNIILDPLLIFGIGPFPEMGIAGAALATVLTQSCATLIALYLLFAGRVGLKLAPHHLKLERAKVRKILHIGLPASIGQSATGFGFFILMYVIAMLPNDTIALAAYGIGDRVVNLIFIAINGLSAGISTVLGQSLGAQDSRRAEESVRKGTTVMFAILVTCAVLVYVFRGTIVSFFISDAEVIAEGKAFLSYFLIGIPFFGLFSGINAAFRGSGHNVPSMIIESSRLWVLRIPLAYIFGISLGYGAAGIWIGMALSNVIGSAFAVAYFKTGIWKERVID